MARTIISAEVKANGELRLPTRIRQALHLRGKKNLVGFVIEGKRILLSRATIIPEPTLSDEELAMLAQASKRGAGKRTFRTTDQALEYLWSL